MSMKVVALTNNSEILSELKELFEVFSYELEGPDGVDPASIGKEAVVFLDEELSDSGDWLDRICPEEGKSCPIIYLTDKIGRGTKLNDLILNKKVDVVMAGPPDSGDLPASLRKVFGIDIPYDEGSSASQLPEALIDKYEEGKCRHIETLYLLSHQIAETKDKKKLQEFKNLIHKIAGSAQSFGYAEVTRLCRNTEYQLDEHIHEDEKAPVSDSVSDSLIPFLKRMTLNFQHVYPKRQMERTVAEDEPLKVAEESKEPVEESPSTLRPLLYIVTQNQSLVGMFQKNADKIKSEVMVETDPQIAYEELEGNNFDPRGIVVEDYYPLHHFHGSDLIEAYRRATSSTEKNVVMLMHEESLSEQLKIMKEGVTHFLKIPASPADVGNIMTDILAKTRVAQYKVLVVDDDPFACELVKQALEQGGFEVDVLTDETQLFDELDRFDPHVLMLDINLATYNGWELLTLLRSDVRYRDLIIVIFTGVEKEGVVNKAFAAGADDIVFKPFETKTLQLMIRHLTRRFQSSDMIRSYDPVTGFYRDKPFQVMLQETIHQNIDPERMGVLVLVKIKEFENFKDFLKIKEIEDLLKTITNVLKETFLGLLFGGYLGKGTFALLFENLLTGRVEVMFDQFNIYAKREMHQLEYHQTAIGAGCCKFRFADADVDQVMDGARSALDEALGYSESRMIISGSKDSGESKVERPKLVVVEDDKDLSRILSYIFEKRGYEVRVFDSGQGALSFFAKLKAVDSKMVIILDRMLPDMDGLEILRNLQRKFGSPVKAVFLSSMISEKAVLEGLQEGAVDYITKPFSPSVLIQKIEALLQS